MQNEMFIKDKKKKDKTRPIQAVGGLKKKNHPTHYVGRPYGCHLSFMSPGQHHLIKNLECIALTGCIISATLFEILNAYKVAVLCANS